MKSKQERIQNLSPEYKKRYADRIKKINHSSTENISSATSSIPKVESPTMNTNTTNPKLNIKSSASTSSVSVNPKNNNFKTSGFISKASGWVKKNPKLAAGGALGLATLGTAGIVGYNHYKNKRRDN